MTVWLISTFVAFYGGLVIGALMANSKAREDAEHKAFLVRLGQVTR